MKYNSLKDRVLNEINKALSGINLKQHKSLIDNLCKGNRIFLIAIGRVFLSLQCLGKRLSHLGFDVEIVGSITEKPITKKDLLIVASGSGESILPLAITQKAKQIGCRIFHITSAPKSKIRSLADFVLEIKTPTKIVEKNITSESLFDMSSRQEKSAQPMSSLFDQVLHIYGDILTIEIIKKLKLDKFKILKNHANLE